MPQRPTDQLIAIVGLGGIFPSCRNLDDFWQLIRDGKSAARTPPPDRWILNADAARDPRHGEPDKIVSTRACFVDDFSFDPTGLALDAELAQRLDPMYHLALHAARLALADVRSGPIDRAKTPVILASIALPTQASSLLADAALGAHLVDAMRQAAGRSPRTERHTRIDPLNKLVTGLPAILVASAFGLRGGALTLDAACASSLYAIKLAIDELRAGRANAVLAGGLSRPDSLYTQMGFSQLRALSPSGCCAPFDHRADGLVVGEGAGFVVLKRLDDALAQRDHIHAVIHGVALSNDVGGNLMLPDSEGQLRAMKQAYADAGWSPRDADLIECHGTGTPIGDGVEFESLRQLFSSGNSDSIAAAGRTVIGSVKSNVGHLLTGAGLAGLTKSLLALKHQTLPPTANFERAASGLKLDDSPFTVLREAAPWRARREGQPRRAAISAFGFGGINAHLLLEEFTAPSTPRAPSSTPARPAKPAIAIVAIESREDHDNHGARQLSLRPARYRIPPRELEEMLPQQLLMLDAAVSAWDRAMPKSPAALHRTGIYIGVQLDAATMNFHLRWRIESHARQMTEELGLDLSDEELANYTQQLKQAFHPALNANRTMGALGGLVASRIARALHIGGPSFTLSSHHTSAAHALDAAIRSLQQGELDAAIVGAVDFQPGPDSDHADRGFASAFVLQRLDDAQRDGRTVLAVVRGVGHASSGPHAETAALAIERALGDADADAQMISHLQLDAHDSTADALRAASLKTDLASLDHPRAVTLTVSCAQQTIDTGSAAAGLSLAKLAHALHRRIRPAAEIDSIAGQLAKSLPGVAISPTPQYWLRNRVDGPRLALALSLTIEGACSAIVLEESPQPCVEVVSPLPAPDEAIFALEGDSIEQITAAAQSLHALATQHREWPLASLAHRWLAAQPLNPTKKFAAALVPESIEQLISLLQQLTDSLQNDPAQISSNARGRNARLFFTSAPLSPQGKIAFMFPGSGNHFFGMARELLAHFPRVLEAQDANNLRLADQFAQGLFWSHPATACEPDQKAFIFSQVALGTMLHDVAALLSIKPDAVIGYSLGETAGLFSTHTWTARDEMLERMSASRLFTHDLAGPCEAARKTWGLAPTDAITWSLGVVDCPAAAVRAALPGRTRVYLLIINTPNECVIGGDHREVAKLVADLECHFHPIDGVTTVHCEVARAVQKPYRDLHLFPTHPPKGVAFYSGIAGRSYHVTRETAADSIVGQALDTVDFTRVIEQAYADGVRLFIELGPGHSCARMTAQTLGARPHMARSLCSPQLDGPAALLRLAAHLISHRVPIDLAPIFDAWPDPRTEIQADRATLTLPLTRGPLRMPAPPARKHMMPAPPSHVAAPPVAAVEAQRDSVLSDPLVANVAAVAHARAAAHEAYLRMASSTQSALAHALANQIALLGALQPDEAISVALPEFVPSVSAPTALFPYESCMEFAVGSIAKMLGPEFAEADTFPTRVRLPDEPLMLAHRIMELEGTPRSLSHGRVVTEHDIAENAWYLDGGRIPTCIAVEAGQADLFLSGYLGIDFVTRGLAMYRLLDAVVTFHRGLPGPGATIRYDIHIDRFFQQGSTHLFRFRFEATVDGEPLLSMSKGIAGFFKPEQLAEGKGVIHTALDLRSMPGKRPPDWRELAPFSAVESLNDSQVNALRLGDLSAAFGDVFAGRTLHKNLRLPAGRMTLVHRIESLEPAGGRFSLGQIRGEADIHPDDWFLTCHFVDDQVMPGTLMYECCMHTLRVHLLRMGWIVAPDHVSADGTAIGCEPVPGVHSTLKCRGQVIASTKKVTYQITIKELGYNPSPYVIADALMFADGKPIVEILDMSLQVTGVTRADVEAEWQVQSAPSTQTSKQDSNLDPDTLPRPAVDGFDTSRILAYAIGKPSEGFGEPYRIFDNDRIIARLPGPPYMFVDRIVELKNCRPFQLEAGGIVTAQYDVPASGEGAWYFDADRQRTMPFAVLLEIALQPCGWLAAYLGSALTSPIDISFRNLGGSGTQLRAVTPETGTLTTTVKITRVSSSGGMIIQNYDLLVRSREGVIYKGDTYFGFFTKQALANQVGVRDAKSITPPEHELARAESFDMPDTAPFPTPGLRMIDRIDAFAPAGGSKGLGYLRGSKAVDPGEWFFKAHFYQDPVVPGSLGLESMLQLMKVAAARRWPRAKGEFQATALHRTHKWSYRGQVIPTNSRVTTEALITKVDEATQTLTADGFLSVDGRVIYQMNDFTISVV